MQIDLGDINTAQRFLEWVGKLPPVKTRAENKKQSDSIIVRLSAEFAAHRQGLPAITAEAPLPDHMRQNILALAQGEEIPSNIKSERN